MGSLKNKEKIFFLKKNTISSQESCYTFLINKK